ncbi:hypothetical protein QYF61_016247 [Mycteria americana]|uniref:Uncharacterized protein n=1 Tax=Mycteria americana TaxID=33587 RepID=A0AAN7MIH5_MYCAM|nr:hypothetical protein QYF61_016247 [Mycteria americana]
MGDRGGDGGEKARVLEVRRLLPCRSQSLRLEFTPEFQLVVQQHRNSSDALAICQPRRKAIAVIKMFPGTAECWSLRIHVAKVSSSGVAVSQWAAESALVVSPWCQSGVQKGPQGGGSCTLEECP